MDNNKLSPIEGNMIQIERSIKGLTPLEAKEAAAHVESLLRLLHVNVLDENFKDTPERFVQYLSEHLRPSYILEGAHENIKKSTFPSSYKGMVTLKNCKVHGMCPHHLLPVEYNVSLAYIPTDRVLGLSKLARIAYLYGRQAELQETTTQRIADALEDMISTLGVMVILEGMHSCMSIRGVKDDDAVTITSAVTGVFRDPEEQAREEFLALVRGK